VKVIPKALAALAGQALACIEDPAVVKRILAHLDKAGSEESISLLPACRAPPQISLFGSG